MKWSGADTAPTLTRAQCRRCGADIDTFTTDYGRPVRLEVEQVPVTVDLEENHRRLWEYRGPRVGWAQPFSPVRTWRELRLEHPCARNTRKHKSERKHK